jgi:hypothetical protein
MGTCQSSRVSRDTSETLDNASQEDLENASQEELGNIPLTDQVIESDSPHALNYREPVGTLSIDTPALTAINQGNHIVSRIFSALRNLRKKKIQVHPTTALETHAAQANDQRDPGNAQRDPGNALEAASENDHEPALEKATEVEMLNVNFSLLLFSCSISSAINCNNKHEERAATIASAFIMNLLRYQGLFHRTRLSLDDLLTHLRTMVTLTDEKLYVRHWSFGNVVRLVENIFSSIILTDETCHIIEDFLRKNSRNVKSLCEQVPDVYLCIVGICNTYINKNEESLTNINGGSIFD